jgi:hypothetical protein
MPAKEIKELRIAGKLEEALAMAEVELTQSPDNVWAKRNISWVFYACAKKYFEENDLEMYMGELCKIKSLNLPEDEVMLYESLTWLHGKFCFQLFKDLRTNSDKIYRLWMSIKDFHYIKPSESYSFLYKAFHKAFKESFNFVAFADWWNFEYFLEKDYQKEVLPSGMEMMPMVEQAYIAYAKHLLPKNDMNGYHFDKEKTLAFLPKLEAIVDKYPSYQYPGYFQAKLLIALGDNQEHILSILLPFVKRTRNDFWAWDVLSEVFKEEEEKVIACYCKALSLKSPDEMLVNLRQRMAGIFIEKNLFAEAKTEIEKLYKARIEKEFPIPAIVNLWMSSGWYASTKSYSSNINFYNKYINDADALLFSGIVEEIIFIDFVNKDKKMANFITDKNEKGFFKYERFFKELAIGDLLQVRFEDKKLDTINKLLTTKHVTNETFLNKFLKKINGSVKITEGKSFGFINDYYIQPEIVSKYKLENGQLINATIIKSFNRSKNEINWKVYNVF